MSRKKDAVPVPVALPDLTTTREVINALKQLYMEKIRPIEVAYNFAEVRTLPEFLVQALWQGCDVFFVGLRAD
jgi:hypothetical protein